MNIKILLLLCLTANQINAHAIIFDLHGVLMYSSKCAFLNQIGIPTLLQYSLIANSQNIEQEFFDFLHRIKPITDAHPGWHTEKRQLPQIMNDWLKGTLRSQDIKLLIHEHADTYYQDVERKQMAITLTDMIFTPHTLANNTTVCTQAVALVRLCKMLGHKTYVLSNLDPETYVCLQERYPWLWELFDGIIISGTVGCIKPDPKIYTLALEQFDIDPLDALFIDDICHNVRSAEQLGIFGIVCKQCRVGCDKVPYIKCVKDMIKMWWDAQFYKKYFALKKALATLH